MEERVILQELMLDARRSIRNLSTVSGLRALASFPVMLLRRRRTQLEEIARTYLVPEDGR